MATKSYRNTITKAKASGYNVTLLYFWLDSIDLAIRRIQARVAEGGHNIPTDVIKRRYFAGLKNFFEIYYPICDYWLLLNNSEPKQELNAERFGKDEIDI